MPVMKCQACGHEFKKLFGLPGAKIKCPKCGSEQTVVVRMM
jgi:rubredoxin